MNKLYRFSVFTACAGLLLVAAGGLVTSHQAGLSVPDWPLSYGQWMPPMVGKIFWEHGHRMIASFVGFLTLVMCVATHYTRGASTNLKSFARILLDLVILQGVFGGLTVIYNLPHAVSIIHASLGQIFFTCLWVFSYTVKGEAGNFYYQVKAEEETKLTKAFRIARVTFFLLIAQLLLGAATRHVRHLHIAWTHIIFALVITVHILLIFLRVSSLDEGDKAPRTAASLLLYGVLLQIILGAVSLALTDMNAKIYDPTAASVFFTTFHQTLGASILAITAVLVRMLKKRTILAAAAKN